MKRYRHYYWQARGQRFPTRIAVLDCLGEPQTPVRLGNPPTDREMLWQLSSAELRSGEPVSLTTVSGKRLPELWKSLASLCISRETTWVFSPNMGGMLEYIGLWWKLENSHVLLAGKDFRVDNSRSHTGQDTSRGLLVTANPPTLVLCQFPKKRGKLLFCDTRNYGIDPPEGSKDLNGRIGYYLSGLCDCLQTLRQNGPVSLRGTAGSQAMQALRADRICVRLHCHTNESALRLERSAVYGGRCECFRIGRSEETTYHLDFRNQYPSICLTLPVPCSIKRICNDSKSIGRCVERSPEACIAHVRIETRMPAFPVVYKGRTIYPCGIFDTILCGPELLRAKEENAIRCFYWGVEYNCSPALAPFYQRWLTTLSQARSAGKQVLQMFLKRMMNALPGKFNEPGRRWVPCPRRTERGPYERWSEPGPNGKDVNYRNIAHWTQREEVHEESYWSIPAIYGWITSAGRCRLYDAMSIAGWSSLRYCDTDSIICNESGFLRLLARGYIREGKIGHLRLLGRYRTHFIHGIRHYELGEAISCSGVPKDEIQAGESRVSYYERRRQETDNDVSDRPGYRAVGDPQYRPEPYDLGIVGPDGSVSPFHLEGDEKCE